MGAGAPVVTSAGTATEELVAAGPAWRSTRYDVDAIAGAMASVLDDDDLADRLRAAGRERAACHTWAGTAAATIAAYEEVLGTMRVGCNLLWLVPGNVGGTETATVALLREIARGSARRRRADALRARLVRPDLPRRGRGVPHRTWRACTGRLRGVRVAAENSWLARQAKGEVDLVHHMGGVLPPVQGAPGLVTIHDLQPFDMPENFTSTKRTYLHRSIPRSVRRAVGVIAPTEFVRSRHRRPLRRRPRPGRPGAVGGRAAEHRGERRPGPGPLRAAAPVVRVPVVHLEPQEPRPAAAGLRHGGRPTSTTSCWC